MKLALLVLLAGCGRIGFADRDVTDGEPVFERVEHDEDGDGTGDAIDVCPGVADDQLDTDGDGVGDACDPNPSVATEKILLFDAFDGDAALGWQRGGIGTWTIASDDLVGTYSTDNAAVIAIPGTFAPPITITTAYRFVAPNPDNANTTASIVDALDLAALDSEKCGQVDPPGITIGREQAGETVEGKSVAYPDAFVIGGEYSSTMRHDPTLITCGVGLGGKAPTVVTAPPYRTGGAIGLRIRDVIVAFHYLFVIGER